MNGLTQAVPASVARQINRQNTISLNHPDTLGIDLTHLNWSFFAQNEREPDFKLK
ncbi:MAG: hypothetical protein HC840_17075 [Leptolyngbyaceae cyanobacterium RM2_2_4]|nr:hypothetical protein [Leptolyngbyaceae cyanobacterium SM1_4_3]NJN92081.1 hypothetical protein [Leptolyngbyaceae cyanobacterium SL_5_14]NJO50869.1 hypothetical protein [Leptolyngbyaceae cyanobacterium RM2_2_4]